MTPSHLHVHDRYFEEDSKRVAPPSHRHAAPSAPWPWIDIEDEVDPVQLSSPLPPVPEPCNHKDCGGCWRGYPQSLYPNWTPRQVQKSKISDAITSYDHSTSCVIHQVDVTEEGLFHVPNPGHITSSDNIVDETWEQLKDSEAPENNRVRILFVENMSGPVIQMLGAKYNIEPFFYSSSLNWIPSRYVEGIHPGEGDHITIALTFVRSVSNTNNRIDAHSPDVVATSTMAAGNRTMLVEQMIDTQAPLALESNERLLVLDLLSVHLIRRKRGSVIISYHANKDLPTTTAPYLHERIRFAGQSVYWQSIFQNSPDPTFVLLTFLWHALYAWDEALEHLYAHICHLETRVVTTSEMILTQQLHIIRAHHLHYTSLLDDFRKSIVFIRDTPNPAMDSLTPEDRDFNERIMRRECSNLLSEIDRLESDRELQERRLKNVMNLVFSSVNILDSRRMQKMTEAAAKDSAGMKQIAYLTMVFLPASFVAAVFGMNIQNLTPGVKGTLAHYVEAALPLTLVTIWVIIASQNRYIFPPGILFWKRLAWPIILLGRIVGIDPYKKRKVNRIEEPYPEDVTSITIEEAGKKD
ncbi:hypothetical protein BDN70DRAFT_885294 [Pholiota conissans]|uniref:Uncharacterized protein n=1 Tax=Pholiota conissans TaxID=109636 RepID=A0A9P5YQK2_9AGAR|nr:hypothetical protein BDN70DRAFT_885294 [Pholiota conissans]